MKVYVQRLILICLASLLLAPLVASSALSSELGQIVLTISPSQVAGQPFLNTAGIVLLDDSGQVLTDYDIAAYPIQLVPASGQLVPDVIDNPALLNEGVIDFLTMGVRYFGPTGLVGITAVSGTVISTPVMVTFNGYDIVKAFDWTGGDIETIYSGLLTTIRVVVQNNGDSTAHEAPTLKSYFRSGGGSVKSFLTPGAGGLEDTITVDLPTDNLAGGSDSLVLMLESHYWLEDSSYAAFDSLVIPVTVLIPELFDFVEGSLQPDSVYAGDEFDLSFQVATEDFSGPVDSTRVMVRLYADTSEPALATIYDGTPIADWSGNDTLAYSGLAALIDTAAELDPGWYTVRLDYYLVSEDNLYALDIRYPDSLCLVAPVALSYIDGSLAPVKVSVGRAASFMFTLLLGGTEPLEVEAAGSGFTVVGDGFSTTVGLLVPSGMLQPGTNHLTTDSVLVPASQAGENLTVSALLSYRQSGVANHLKFTTDCGGEMVLAENLPSVQLTEVRAVAPNSPRVNISQPFRIGCKVANLSNTTISSFTLNMTSDGDSDFQPQLQVDSIPALDVVEFFFDVVASADADPGETFQVSILSPDLYILSPLDSSATVITERPADLRLTWDMPGAETGVVAAGTQFNMVVDIENEGDADVSPAIFQLTTNGIDLGVSDPLIDTMMIGSPYSVSLLASDFDTTFVLGFELIERPIDLNDALPAQIDDTAFEQTIRVLSLETDLSVESEVVTSNLVMPGAARDLFSITLVNQGVSSLWDMEIEEITLGFTGRHGERVDAGSVVQPDGSGFFENGVKISAATAEQDRLTLIFDGLVLEAGEQRRLVFRAAVYQSVRDPFEIILEADAVNAVFISGSHAGQAVTVGSATGGSSILDEIYTPVGGASVEATFVTKQNPFNPMDSPAEFQFYLAEPSQVEFHVFTLIGEEVFSRVYAEGSLVPAGDDSFVTLTWDGRNDEGHVVFNGVYIAMISVVKTGEEARLKIAVVK